MRMFALSLRKVELSCRKGVYGRLMDPPVQLDAVSKHFGRTIAVRNLSLSVPAQCVYGFLGPNGAGKSTTIRLILGLLRPTSGDIVLFGRPLAAERLALLGRIGSMVESPSLYLHLTGKENLEIHRCLLSLPPNTIGEALDVV